MSHDADIRLMEVSPDGRVIVSDIERNQPAFSLHDPAPQPQPMFPGRSGLFQGSRPMPVRQVEPMCDQPL